MLKNYFITTIRNLWRNKVTGFINLFGLAIGMTAAVYIFLWVQNEASFDNYHPDKNNIYRITNTIQIDKTETWKWESSPMLLAETALKEIPEVKKATRVTVHSWTDLVLNIDHKLFSEKKSAYIDKTWFDIFHYDFIKGSPASFAQNPFSIILTESKAKKYFGNEDALGKVIRIDTVNYTVQGLVKDNPLNSSFQFDILLNVDGYLSDPRVYKNDKTWNNFGYITFIVLRPDANKSLVEAKLNGLFKKNRKNNNTTASLLPLSKMYFENDLQNSGLPHGNKKTTYIFSILGLLLLITACINYVNLTTAKASLRAKEVSIRKIVGAGKGSLFVQFITESLIVSVLSLIFTLFFIRLCIPLFNAITEKQFELNLTSFTVWKVLLGTLFFAALINGIYPALLLSSFKPLNVFRGMSVLKIRDGSIRKGLVVFQFSLSVALIITAIVIYKQLRFIQTSNPGYNVSQVISLQIPFQKLIAKKPGSKENISDEIKRDLQSQSSIAAVATGGNEIVNVTSSSSGNADWDGHDTAYNPTIARFSVDADFQKMFDLHLKMGRWFTSDISDEHNYILNETAVNELNIHRPVIGQRFTWGGDTGQIVGTVKDFHYRDLHEKIGPMVLINNTSGNPYGNPYLFLKTNPGNISKALKAAEAIWMKYIPDQPFSYIFLDESFDRLYKSDIKTSNLIFVFSIIAIIISALGLFGLAAFTAEQRTKEVGIRKVLGASVSQIATLLSKDFIKLVLIAIVIASPLAWWATNKWLQDFAYRINVNVWIFFIGGSLALVVAFVSVSIQAIKAATANPVKSLRTE